MMLEILIWAYVQLYDDCKLNLSICPCLWCFVQFLSICPVLAFLILMFFTTFSVVHVLVVTVSFQMSFLYRWICKRRGACFFRLCNLLRDTINFCVEEQVAMFLHIVSHNQRFRVIHQNWRRSIETVHRHFKEVSCRTMLGQYMELISMLKSQPRSKLYLGVGSTTPHKMC